jgi:CTD kinase subunit gamma
MPETVTELEALLKARDIAPSHPFIAEAANDTTQTGGQRLDKRQVEQRIEEDRERHKRLRENIWAVPGEGDAEMERLWEEASDIGDDDWEACKEDLGERRQGIEFG